MWKIDLSLIRQWISEQDVGTRASIYEAFEVLSSEGLFLRRPLVGEISRSKFKNLKELRPASSGRSEVRIIFAFDPAQVAIMLVAGDKANSRGLKKAAKWNRWYSQVLPRAEFLYDEHLKDLD